SKNEVVPFGYVKAGDENDNPLSLNAGTEDREEMYLCYKTRDRKHFQAKHDMFFNPQILDRYPTKDYPEFPLNQSFAMFCFPRGIEIVPGKSIAQNKSTSKTKFTSQPPPTSSTSTSSSSSSSTSTKKYAIGGVKKINDTFHNIKQKLSSKTKQGNQSQELKLLCVCVCVCRYLD
ncbi:hypothetical protein RFI_16945, partial [Reticulomyxa filosa]